MTKRIQDIEGIGPKYGETLSAIGLNTTAKLLEVGATARGRAEIAEKTQINEKLILKWVNMCDLFRISGVASQYAELLENAGVDTVKELRHRNAENLTEKMAQINQEKKLVRQIPSQKAVVDWIEQAKTLDPVVNY